MLKKKQIAQKIRENVVADQIGAYVIYEWSLRENLLEFLSFLFREILGLFDK